MTAVANPRGTSHVLEVLRSEQCKLVSVRSTWWTAVAAVGSNVGLAVLLAVVLPGQVDPGDLAGVDPVRVSLGGIHLSQIAIGVLGVLVITSEYGTGMIRASFAAVPQRRLVLAAKVAVFTAAALVIGILSSLAAYLAFQAFVTGEALNSSIGDPGVLRAVIGGGLFLTAIGLLGLGLGAVVRSSAIAALLGLLFVPGLLVDLLPASWRATILPYVPMEAGGQIFIAQPAPESLGAWTGFAVFCLYAAIALGAAFSLIDRRDA